MSPEVARGNFSSRSDVWSAAICLYILMALEQIELFHSAYDNSWDVRFRHYHYHHTSEVKVVQVNDGRVYLPTYENVIEYHEVYSGSYTIKHTGYDNVYLKPPFTEHVTNNGEGEEVKQLKAQVAELKMKLKVSQNSRALQSTIIFQQHRRRRSPSHRS